MLIGSLSSDMLSAASSPAMLGMPSTDGSPSTPTVRNTLWQGDLEQWIDEAFLRQLWASYCGEHVGVKLVRNKVNNGQGNSAFIEFSSHEMAARCLQQFNGAPLPNSPHSFRLTWAGASTSNYGSRSLEGPEFSLFVGDLGREVNDYLLFSTFHQRFPTCKTAKVVVDPVTNNSKGYGFVRFSDESDCYRAMHELNGQYCGSRPMRISAATPRTPKFGGTYGSGIDNPTATHAGITNAQSFVPSMFQQTPLSSQNLPPQQLQQQHAAHSYLQQQFQQRSQMQQHQQVHSHQQQQQQQPAQMRPSQIPASANGVMPGNSDPSNAKVFVGGLAAHVTEEELRAYFAPFGEIIYVKIPAGKGCGFVHYGNKNSADKAIAALNGVPVGGSPVRLSWARTAADKQRLTQHAMTGAPVPPLSSPITATLSNGMSIGSGAGSSSGSPPNGFMGVGPIATGMYYDGAFAPVELMNGASTPQSGRASPTGSNGIPNMSSHLTGSFGSGLRDYAPSMQQPTHPSSSLYRGMNDTFGDQNEDMNAEFSRRFGGDADAEFGLDGVRPSDQATTRLRQQQQQQQNESRWRFNTFQAPNSQLFA